MGEKGKGRFLKFDPRTELLLLVLANVVAFSQRSVWVEMAWVVVLLLLITACGCGRPAVKYGGVFAFFLLLQYYIFPRSPKIIASTFFILVSYARKMFPCLIVGCLIVKTTTIRELTAALRSWHVPQSLIIPLSVTFRYIPAIREEIGYIRDAMKFRDIHGMRRLEYLLVPMMISATATADELAAAAVTRGVENPGAKTSLLTLKMGIRDVICLGCGAIFCAVSFMAR